MELQFYGATERVTGSCHILKVQGRCFLLDCGLIQGLPEEEALNRSRFPFDPAEVDAVILSHGHIDHSGRLPLLVREGFSGPIYVQRATRDLALVLLQDSARLAEQDVRYRNRHAEREGLAPVEPLSTVEDAITAVNLMQPLSYDERHSAGPGVEFCFRDAGHILGSAIVELWLEEDARRHKLVYSGDLGQFDSPILRDPVFLSAADTVIIESTYGDRQHKPMQETLDELGGIIRSARQGGGNILIPAFAIGRSQELLYLFGMHFDAWQLDGWRMFLDSPMAIEATAIYWEYPELYDEDAAIAYREAREVFGRLDLTLTRKVEQSMKINDIESGAIIIAGSGMCNGGRILYHLKQNIERPECHLLFTGYQAEGTLGRAIVEGRKSVRIHGRDYMVRAAVHTIGGMSAHGDCNDMLRWAEAFRPAPDFYVVHGDEQPKQAFAAMLRERLGAEVHIPAAGESIELG
ncbi:MULTISPECIES: MBL fold metallo-hydrolase RNA specificity domain-containing protein [Prosthecochloris]|uniref:MBL fold metallo-hydrolase n=1 Tax=Prosthecochloris vibrioformis TaxID=1098 RepID=A0A5C4RYQ0_PROVB|nr:MULTISPECIES: MBL fold metallo-hydrolase [Prosthecochloris]ANT65348.1 Ribonuclease [Prosthecochloris sp. CIB 2401]TNJ36224.1 MBL fold metallo-hydrolase [Prosthecochloris vibrioformis]